MNISLSENDCLELQADLQRLVQWSERWQLHFNADKCKVLHLGRNNRHLVYKIGYIEYANFIWHPDYQMDKLAVEKVQRRATLVPHLKHMSYEEQLVALRHPITSI